MCLLHKATPTNYGLMCKAYTVLMHTYIAFTGFESKLYCIICICMYKTMHNVHITSIVF